MRISKVLVVLGMCLGVLLFTNCLKAEDIQGTVQGLINDGVPPEVVDDLFSGPSDVLGQRVNDMLKAGTITQRQYDAVSNRFLSLPDEQRWAIKNAYTKGDAAKLYDATTGIAHRRLGDDASVRDHAKDLRQLGLNRDQIKNRLIAEGVDPAKIDALLASEGSVRGGHAKDIRATETPEAQHKVDRAHEKKQDIKAEPSRPGHLKDTKPERARERGDVGRGRERRR